MLNPRLANRYAKSLLDIAKEQNKVAQVYADMLFFDAACKCSKEFQGLLKSPIISATKKIAVIDAVCKDLVSTLTKEFYKLVITKAREGDLYEIVREFLTQYNELKGIHKVKLTVATAINTSLQSEIATKIKNINHFNEVALEVVVDEKLIGGFMVEFDNQLLDASISTQLRKLKKQLL